VSIEHLKERLPEYAKDLKLNLSSIVTSSDKLTDQQIWGTLLASAMASGNEEVIQAISSEASVHLSEVAVRAAKGAFAIMSMNNIYYRFVHLADSEEYKSLPAKLRMNIMGNPGVEKKDFELWSLAVSAINGCGMCINGHEAQLVREGASREAIQQAVRIAAVVKAVAAVLSAESVAVSSQ
jgi:alkyl hydroperoxide reductase subunit D